MTRRYFGIVFLIAAVFLPAIASAQQGNAVLISRGMNVQGKIGSSAVQGSLIIAPVNNKRGGVNILSRQKAFARRTSEYTIQTVPAGTYGVLGGTFGNAQFGVGRNGTILPAVTLAPGEVVYLGDIEVTRTQLGRKLIAVINLRDDSAAARAALAAKDPKLAKAMKTKLLQCPNCRKY